MLTQTVLPFKLESTGETLTAQAGLALLGEFLHAIGLQERIDAALPAPGSAKGYAPSCYAVPIMLMLHGGGRRLEDLRPLRADEGLRRVLSLGVVPSADAAGDWLRRMGEGEGLAGLLRVHREVLRRALREEERTRYTLDIDATQIIAEKKAAHFTYQGERGYMPMVGHLAENGLVVGEEFREGNDAPGARNLAFIRHCAAQMPGGKKIAALRADSAAYQAAIFNWCEDKRVEFAIGADLDRAVKALIAHLPDTAWAPYGQAQIAEAVHCMNGTKKAFRLIVVRHPLQTDLLDATRAHRYSVIASNRREAKAEVMDWYRQRGETSENRIKELKIGFGMERLPCGQKQANAMFFRLGVLAYNVFVMFKRLALEESWQRHQVQTVRWRLYQTAAKVVRHAGALYLKVREDMVETMQAIRERCARVAVT